MKYNELSVDEQRLVLNSRLNKLDLNIVSGSCNLIGTVLTKDDNKIALAVEDQYADKQILLTLSEDQIDDLYNFLKSRYILNKELMQIPYEPAAKPTAKPTAKPSYRKDDVRNPF